MKTLNQTLLALALSAAVAPAAFAQANPPGPAGDPSLLGQPAAPTSPAETRKPPAAARDMATEPGALPPAIGLPPAPKVQRAGTVEYVSGGAGEESRAAIEAMQDRFALRNVFSGQGGRYVVPEKVVVRSDGGATTEINNAGPLLVMALPPGKYTIEAAVQGQVQRKTVTLTQQPVKLNWNWPNG